MRPEHWPLELALTVLAAALNALLVRQTATSQSRRLSAWLGLTVWTTISLNTSAAAAIRLFEWMPGVSWLRAMGASWLLVAPWLLLSSACWRKGSAVDPGRRRLLRAAAVVAVAPAGVLAYGFSVARRDTQVREVDLAFKNLPGDLDGIRIVQVSDIHLSPFLSRSQLRRVVDQANETRSDLAVVTGDLITSYGDPLDAALAELKHLRATAGIYGCLGNHEILAEAEDYATEAGARQGLRFLRSQAASLRFGSARLNLAGVDYQKKGSRYLAGADSLIRANEFNLLLSHNPDVFPVAAQQGWDLTLAGHTHGGQVTLEFLHASLNPARFYTPFTYGTYREKGRAIYVTRGIGTVGVPARFGAPPEVAVIRLVRG